MGEAVVLVVDDEPAHLRALRRALSGIATVRCAASGAEALQAAEDGRVRLVVSDQRMDGMSGVELLEEVRSRHPATVLVLLTAYADVEALQRAINRIGIYHFLEKPWGVFELRQVVARGLERFDHDRERERLVDELRRSCSLVRKEAEYKSRLLTVLAHELGTPVHIAVNAVGLLAELPVDARARPWLEALGRAADRLARGIGQMQRGGAAGCGQIRLKRGSIDLPEVAAEMVCALRLAARDREVEVVERHAPDLRVFGDRAWLGRLVWNLLTNAMRWTPDGGRIALETDRNGEWGMLVVEDSGVGLVDEQREDLFVPFSNACGDPVLHGSGWLRFGARGLGLGLAICRNIVDLHGGEIDLESPAGVGTVCRVRLPLADPAGVCP